MRGASRAARKDAAGASGGYEIERGTGMRVHAGAPHPGLHMRFKHELRHLVQRFGIDVVRFPLHAPLARTVKLLEHHRVTVWWTSAQTTADSPPQSADSDTPAASSPSSPCMSRLSASPQSKHR